MTANPTHHQWKPLGATPLQWYRLMHHVEVVRAEYSLGLADGADTSTAATTPRHEQRWTGLSKTATPGCIHLAADTASPSSRRQSSCPGSNTTTPIGHLGKFQCCISRCQQTPGVYRGVRIYRPLKHEVQTTIFPVPPISLPQ